ncbi:polysaccharide pyruvyl transferase family protein [Sunxiuqinia indica]|uniref:polysaccharide pyruvyl transferase family protein n=1 Tax=Sunxiuqinia indica TaxID=2692584 RepID=UPI001914FD7B|nr:polysaccharide pyruvyl transferase family protein [Sunxiuqinia indica]
MNKKINRRRFLNLSSSTVFAMLFTPEMVKSEEKLLPSQNEDVNLGEGRTILLLSGWQDVNIGDIAHTPGLLRVLLTFLPKAKVILWKRSLAIEPVKELLHRNFPNVKVIYGNVDDDKKVTSVEVLDAFKESDIMIHGSGPSVQGQKNLEAWLAATGKPFGIFGVTIQSVGKSLKELLSKASFIYTRETASLEVLSESGISGEHVSFVPDATFFMEIRDDQRAAAFLAENGLETKKFICAVPRLRRTPYYKFTDWKWSEERIKNVEETNSKYKEEDHAKLREAMIRWVRETGNKVLVCPEMVYEVEIMDELLIDPLPEDVKPYVVKRGYWMPDEAASVYRNAHSVLSFECHSPIIALHNGTPAFYLRQPEDTIKGQMYYDLGYDDWVFEIMETEGKQIADQLMTVHVNYKMAQEQIVKTNERIRKIYADAVELV